MQKRFINPFQGKIRRTFWDVILWKGGYYDDKHSFSSLPLSFEFPIPQKQFNKEKPSVCWINHSTFLIEVNGKRFLTDPIWSNRCSPCTFLGPKRKHIPPLTLEELPDIHYVLISHNHYDHLDEKSVLGLHRRFPNIIWMVPSGVRSWFLSRGIENVWELGWWEEHFFDESKGTLKITAVPSQHFSGRSLTDLNTTLWVGWVVEFYEKPSPHNQVEAHPFFNEAHLLKRFYFVGDTGYNNFDFKNIGLRWKTMDLTMIPIGSYLPRKFMSPVHLNPQEAVWIHREVGSFLSLAMHWKTFRLSDELMDQPPYDLFLALKEENIDPETFLAITPGVKLNW